MSHSATLLWGRVEEESENFEKVKPLVGQSTSSSRLGQSTIPSHLKVNAMHEPPEQRNSLGRQAGMEAAEQHNGRKTHAHTHIKEKSNLTTTQTMTKAKNIPAPNCKTRNRFSGESISLNRNKRSHININAEATLSTAFGFSSSHTHTHTYCNWPRRSRCDNPCARRICGVHRCNFRLRCKWTRYFDTLQNHDVMKAKQRQNKNENHVRYRHNGYTQRYVDFN